MLRLEATDFHWIKPGDQPTDFCAHSPVTCSIFGKTLSVTEDGDWCVSAADVYLLRSLRRSHTKDDQIAEHLIPCCGHTMVPTDNIQDDVLIIGCNQGVDWQIIHDTPKLVQLIVDDEAFYVSQVDWANTVVEFADSVHAFYDRSAPKVQTNEWAFNGYSQMRAEWDRRRADAECLI